MSKHLLVVKYNGMVIEMGGSVPIRKRRYISISEGKQGSEKVIAYFTKDGEKLFDKFMGNNAKQYDKGGV